MVKRRLLPLTGAASLLLLSGIDASGAARAEPAVPDSTAAMLRLHMPFGGRPTAVSQTSLTLNFGHRWQSPADPLEPRELHFTPTLQAGWMFSGRPVLRVGAIDALRLFTDRAYAQAGEAGGSGSARFIWIALGVVAVGATVLALTNSDDDSEYERCPILPPPPPSQPPDCALSQ